MLISFIIPVYNVENYLSQCIDSIICQSFRDIEVILVDDGSTDKSACVCDKYALRDSRIKVIHKENGGLSEARNVGLDFSNGDYVVFVDSDDFWIKSTYLEELVNILQNNHSLDFLGYNCCYYYSDRNLYTNWVEYNKLLLAETNKDKLIINLVACGTFPMSACLKIIKRNFLIENQIYFQKGITAEDIPWFLLLLDRASNFKFVNTYIYAYRQNVQGSITNSFSAKSYTNLFNILKSETYRILHKSYSKELKHALLSFMAYEYCILLGYAKKHLNSYDTYRELFSYRWLMKYTLNPKVKKVSIIYRIFGFKFTCLLLSKYLENKYRK